jgi:hypothetical protein
MIKLILFLLFPFLVLYVPIKYYRSNSPVAIMVWKRLSFHNTYGAKMMVYLLIAIGGFFHLVYFNVFPREIGIMFSTAILIAFCNVGKSYQWLLYLRSNIKVTIVLMLFILVTSFFPHMLATDIMLSVVLECALFLPGDKIEDYNPLSSCETNENLINSYFE